MNQEKKKNGKNTRNNAWIYKVLLVVFALGLVISLGVFVKNKMDAKKAQAEYERLAALELEQNTEEIETETVPEEDTLTQLGIEVPEKNPDWAALKEENADIYAWIYIPGTQVDYPILQDEETADYYLNHNIDGSEGYPGCIYSQKPNAKDFTDPMTVLYGHNMKNGTMFGSLHEYEDNAFFEENRYIYIYTEEKTLVYDIMTASQFSDAHVMYTYNFASVEGYENFIDDVTGVRDMNAHVREEAVAEYGECLLALSTCINGKPQNRWLVTAKLMGVREN